MGLYQIEDAQGRVLELEGDHEPSPAELETIFRDTFGAKPATETPSLRPAIPEPGVTTPTLSGGPLTQVPQAFPAVEQAMSETAKIPALTGAEAEQMLTTPQVSIPRVGEPGTVLRGVSELGAGLVEQAALTPLAPLQNLALAVPGVRLAAGTLLTAAAAKGAAEKLGEASVTGDAQAITEGVGMGLLAGLGATGVAADAMSRVAPVTAEAVKATPKPSTTKASPPEEPPIRLAVNEPETAAGAAESWIKEQSVEAAKTPLGKTGPDAALKVVSEWIRKGETPSGPIPDKIKGALFESLKPTRDLETGEFLDLASPDWPRTGTLINFLESRNTDRMGIVPEGMSKLAELQEGQRLIDQERIKTAVKEQDVLPGRDWIASPEFEFRNMPEAKALVTKINEAELNYKSRVAHATDRFEQMKKSLSQTDREQLTKALFAKESAKDPEAITKLPENLQGPAKEIRDYYDSVRGRVIEDKQGSILNELSGPQQNALRAIQDGVLIEEASKANGLREGGKAIVKSALEEMRELDNWGIEDYTTHIERGSYRIVTDTGGTVAVAETRAAAAIKADKWLKENPGHKSLTITDEFDPGIEFPTQLSRGQYFRLVQRLKDNLGESATEIQNLLRQNGSIVTIKPTQKYAGPMLERKGVLKGEADVFDVLPMYAHIMEKKLALDPVLREAKVQLEALPKEAKQQIQDLIQDVKGRKTMGDRIADAVLAPFGQKPFAYSRTLDTARQVSAKLKLGYRPVAAAVNRISGLQHTWVKTGTKYLLDGKKFLKTPEGEALLQENKPYLGIEAAFVHESGKPKAQEPFYKPLGLFQAAERFNRPESFAALYKYAEGELGLTGDAAVQYARNATRFGQFTYNTASLPRAMRGPTGRFLFQFKPYLVKELEFISSLKGAEIPRYITGFLAVGGPRAALYTLKSLPLIGAVGAFSQMEDWLNQKAPSASRGIGGAVGVDVSPSVAFQFPTTMPELLGPTVADLSKLWNDVVSPALQGEDRDVWDIWRWIKRLPPALNYWSQLVEAAMNDGGWITDTHGRPSYKPTKADMVKLALGAKPLEKSVQEVESRFLRDQEAIRDKNRARLIERFLDATAKQDGALLQEITKDMAEAGITADAVRSAAKGRNIEPQIRLLRSLSKATKAQEAHRFVPDEQP